MRESFRFGFSKRCVILHFLWFFEARRSRFQREGGFSVSMMAGDAAGVNFMTATPQRQFEFLAYFGIGTRLQIRLRIDCELLFKG